MRLLSRPRKRNKILLGLVQITLNRNIGVDVPSTSPHPATDDNFLGHFIYTRRVIVTREARLSLLVLPASPLISCNNCIAWREAAGDMWCNCSCPWGNNNNLLQSLKAILPLEFFCHQNCFQDNGNRNLTPQIYKIKYRNVK